MFQHITSIDKIHIKPKNSVRQVIILVLFLFSLHFLFQSSILTSYQQYSGPRSGNACIRPNGIEDRAQTRFAIVLDAGSTGSRIHIYRFSLCGNHIETVEDEVYDEVQPGLSSYKNDALAAAKSLKPLLKRAERSVPRKYRSTTSIVLKATAGLRLLKESDSEAILQAVQKIISRTKFHLGPIQCTEYQSLDSKLKNAVTIMDGREEGTLAWLTVKFLQKQTKPTVLEMGGGSSQIVFEVDNLPTERQLWDKYYSREYIGGKDHIMYRNSYLGFGLMEARKTILKGFAEKSNSTFSCLPEGHMEKIETSKQNNSGVVGSDTNFEICCNHVTDIMFPKTSCAFASGCSFNNTHQPSLVEMTSVIAFSYFNDRLKPLNLTTGFTIEDIKNAGSILCKSAIHSNSLIKDNPLYCLDISFIYAFLKHGLNFTPNNILTCTKKINGYEAGWALGCAVQLLERSLSGKCS